MVKGSYIARSGYVLIINNYPLPIGLRRVSEKEVFAQTLGFMTREDINLATSEMLKALTDTAQREFCDNDCFCCIIRSTGTEHGICGTDVKPIDIKTITSLFSSDKCPSLDGKPKIFVLGVSNFEFEFYFEMRDESKGVRKDGKASRILQHLVISEKDFLVWSRFDEPYEFVWNWSELISFEEPLENLIKSISSTKTREREPISFVSTLTNDVYFKRK